MPDEIASVLKGIILLLAISCYLDLIVVRVRCIVCIVCDWRSHDYLVVRI